VQYEVNQEESEQDEVDGMKEAVFIDNSPHHQNEMCGLYTVDGRPTASRRKRQQHSSVYHVWLPVICVGSIVCC